MTLQATFILLQPLSQLSGSSDTIGTFPMTGGRSGELRVLCCPKKGHQLCDLLLRPSFFQMQRRGGVTPCSVHENIKAVLSWEALGRQASCSYIENYWLWMDLGSSSESSEWSISLREEKNTAISWWTKLALSTIYEQLCVFSELKHGCYPVLFPPG